MPLDRIRDRYGYGGANLRQMINRAIREEEPGGAQVLDAAAALHDAAKELPAADVRERYGIGQDEESS